MYDEKVGSVKKPAKFIFRSWLEEKFFLNQQ